MNASKHTPRTVSSRLLPAALVAVVTSLAVASPSAFAQSLSLEVSPLRESVSSCVSDELEVAVRLVNPDATPIGGYQLFLRFPAESFELVRFESTAIDAFLAVSGPGDLGGFEPCTSDGGDPWDDGLGEDVIAIVGSVFGEGSQEPFTGTDAELGRAVFRPTGQPTGAEGALFRLNEDPCHLPIEQVSRVFGASGAALEATVSPGFQVTVDDAGPQLRQLTCIDREDQVELLWVYPDEEHSGVNVYRNGELYRTIPIPAVVTIADDEPLPGVTTYEVAIRLAGGEGCRLSCVIDRTEPEFVRGDANRDDSVNVTDAVAVLDHLFAGIPITCLDSGDADDSGSINLTDAVVVLEHLFQGGGPLPAPFPDPGSDPTDDALDCGA